MLSDVLQPNIPSASPWATPRRPLIPKSGLRSALHAMKDERWSSKTVKSFQDVTTSILEDSEDAFDDEGENLRR